MKIIDGKKLAEKIKDEVVAEIVNINNGDACAVKRPGLAIVLIGKRADSEIYVALKEKEAKKCGIDTHTYKFSEEVEESEIKETIKFLNKDEEVNAILLQLPLPKKFDTDEIVKLIDPKKDVDGFHPKNLEKILNGCPGRDNLPPLIQVVLEIIDSVKVEIKDKDVCVLVNSDVFGDSLKKIFTCQGGKVDIVKIDEDWKSKSKKADILITAIGKKQFIKKEDIKKDALIIDIGITNEDGKVYGDVDMEDVKDVAGFITPVPGGVGPMTIAFALKSALILFKN